MITMVALVATINSDSTIRGWSLNNKILHFRAKVRPYFPTVVSEPSCSVLTLNEMIMCTNVRLVVLYILSAILTESLKAFLRGVLCH